MFYPLDFRFQSEKQNNNQFTVSVSSDVFDIKNNNKVSRLGSKPTSEDGIWIRYLNNSTVHGLRYLTEPKVKTSERLVWLVLVTSAFLGTLYVSYLLQIRYSTNKLATVVETTMYPVSLIPYPAVTICNNNRVNWIRVPSALDYFLKNASNATIEKLTDIIVGLNSFEFSSFEEFENMTNTDLSDLDHINMTELYLQIIHTCEEMFVDPCWWRNRYMNCCGANPLFVLQRSEYGVCYAFNSVLNPQGALKNLNESDYPWRTTKFGDWSGIRANIRIDEITKIPHIKRKSGILVMVHHPSTWPITAYFVPAGTSTSVKMTPTYSYASNGVLQLQPKERNCLVAEEVFKANYCTLPGTQYYFTNCICNCRMQYLISACNCTVDFIYPSGDNQQCKISDLKCLLSNNDLFNHEKPLPGNQYFSDKEDGMVCDCLPECEAVDYALDVTPSKGSDGDESDNQILLDVHFQRATMFQYRTDVVFDWVDLMVGFGGIAGLFLGCSLMSIAEVIFYFGIGIMKVLRQILRLNRRIK